MCLEDVKPVEHQQLAARRSGQSRKCKADDEQ
jgi:hypothetical protein